MTFDRGSAWLVTGIFVGICAILYAGMWIVAVLVEKWDIDPGWFGVIALMIVFFIVAGIVGGAA